MRIQSLVRPALVLVAFLYGAGICQGQNLEITALLGGMASTPRAIALNDELVATIEADNLVKVWNLASITNRSRHANVPLQRTFVVPDAQQVGFLKADLIAILTQKKIFLHDLTTEEIDEIDDQGVFSPPLLACSFDDSLLATVKGYEVNKKLVYYLRIWDYNEREMLSEIKVAPAHGIAMTPDGNWIALMEREQPTIKIYDTSVPGEPKLAQTLELPIGRDSRYQARSILLWPSGSKPDVFALYGDDGKTKVAFFRGGAEYGGAKEASIGEYIAGASLTRRGRALVYGPEGTIGHVDTDRKPIRVRTEVGYHRGAVLGAVGNNKVTVSIGEDRLIKVWNPDVDRNSPYAYSRHVEALHAGFADGYAFQKEPHVITLGVSDFDAGLHSDLTSAVRFWNPRDGSIPKASVMGDRAGHFELRGSTGDVILGATGTAVRVADTPRLGIIATYRYGRPGGYEEREERFVGHKSSMIYDMCQEAHFFGSASDDGTVKVWELNKRDKPATLRSDDRPMRRVSLSKRADAPRLAAIAGMTRKLAIWTVKPNKEAKEAPTAELKAKISLPERPISLAFYKGKAGDSVYNGLAVCLKDGIVSLRKGDDEQCTEVATIVTHERAPRADGKATIAVGASADGRLLAIASSVKVELYRAADMKLIAESEVETGLGARNVVFSSDGKYFVVGRQDGVAVVYRVPNMRP
jgi:WD40 repeat protein